uniref:Uncharacterized protein n=1 Tax=uncultured Armatimonadetes bacterium TaxID=157466 RepID=A0A6J4HP27_9BACT|nr:hypothetical protein AVDCRST_MAG63-901 [uncultured Armatimonadetes bacterium]
MASTVWKDGARRGIAYVEGREAAERVMAAAGSAPPPPPVRGGRQARAAGAVGVSALDRAMAIYVDRKGRPFAWQIPFPIERWEHVAALVGAE